MRFLFLAPRAELPYFNWKSLIFSFSQHMHPQCTQLRKSFLSELRTNPWFYEWLRRGLSKWAFKVNKLNKFIEVFGQLTSCKRRIRKPKSCGLIWGDLTSPRLPCARQKCMWLLALHLAFLSVGDFQCKCSAVAVRIFTLSLIWSWTNCELQLSSLESSEHLTLMNF